jgi:LysM repeat protein
MKRSFHVSRFFVVMLIFSMVGCAPRTQGQNTPIPSPIFIISPALSPTLEIVFQDTPSPIVLPSLIASDIPTLSPIPPSTSTLCSTPAGWVVYLVQPGDNLFRVALRYNMSAIELQSANCLSSDTIFVGQTLYVPYFIPPTFPPAPIPPTATQRVLPDPDLLDRISMDLGSEPRTPHCPDPAQELLPDIKLSERVKDFFELCIYGFPLGQTIDVKLSPRQDPNFIVSKNRDVVDQYTFPDGNRTTIVKIFLWAPVGLAPDWTVSVSSPGVPTLQRDITFGPFGVKATNIVPDVKIDPFKFQWCDSYSYKRGDAMIVTGTNFDHNVYVSVGLYLETGGELPLIHGQTALTDDSGNFESPYTIQPSDPSGKIWVISITNSPIDRYRKADQDVQCFHID